MTESFYIRVSFKLTLVDIILSRYYTVVKRVETEFEYWMKADLDEVVCVLEKTFYWCDNWNVLNLSIRSVQNDLTG